MKLIKPSYEIWEQGESEELSHNELLNNLYSHIERCGRVCYASEPKPESDPKDFVDRMIRSGHLSVLEHGTVYLHFSNCSNDFFTLYNRYDSNPYSVVKELVDYSGTGSPEALPYVEYYVTTNYRVLVENGWEDDLQYLSPITKYHERRVTVHFTTNIGVSREFNRHKLLCAA